MNILIIGNGFDLAHDLPTSYSDVLKFLYGIKSGSTWHGGKNKFIEERLSKIDISNSICNYIIDAFNSRIEHGNDNCTNSNPIIQEIYDNLDNNIWYTYLWTIFSMNKMNGINWIDFESEISHIIEQIDREEENLYLPFRRLTSEKDEKTNIFFSRLPIAQFLSTDNNSSEHKSTFRDFLDTSYLDLRRLVRCIEIYLTEYVETIPITKFSQNIIDSAPDAVLCFNYTHTFTKYYHFENTIDIHFLHGETRNLISSENNMVLGIDEYYDSYEKNKHTNYNIYKKFTQRILNNTGFLYRNWISEMDDATHKSKTYSTLEDTGKSFPNNIYIFGHSLDITDKDVLKDLIDRIGVKTTIFYHDKQQQTQQIANLVKMLGQDKFIDMINSTPQKICFIHQQPLKNKK